MTITREELLKILVDQCRAYADLERTRAAAFDESQRAQAKVFSAIDRMVKNERDRQRTMERLICIAVGRPDPGPIEQPTADDIKGK